ncbi:MAG: histidine phosphatase family protein [Gammaproteobacteria bacterium]|nr:histidine phosphatase family protein [Gammaproteobacteria bacterium]
MNVGVLTGTTTMKSLYLLRHAKSSWAESGLSDQQRPLSERGLHDAPMMGKRFETRGEILHRVVTSPALRAAATAEMFAEACGFPVQEIEVESDLYFLGSGSIEEVIRRQDDQLHALMLVFHNPDITYFANALDDEIRIDNVPTCGLIRLSSDIDLWRDWSPANTAFEYFDYPKNLSADVITK